MSEGRQNYILDGKHGGHCAHPSPILMHGKMRGEREAASRACLRLVSHVDTWNRSISLPGGGQSGRVCVCGRDGWTERMTESLTKWMKGIRMRKVERERVWVTDSEVGVVEVYNDSSADAHIFFTHISTHAYIMLSVTAFRHMVVYLLRPLTNNPFWTLYPQCL